MVFSSLTFLFFFLPLVLLGYYGYFHKSSLKNVYLLLSSLIFYAWGEPVFVLLMILSILLNFITGLFLQVNGQALGKGQRNYVLGVGVGLNLLMLFYFKYEGFFTEIYNQTYGDSSGNPRESLQLILPIGISFFTFQGISYLIDVSRGTVKPQRNLVDLALYISFFPQLVAGPIVQYGEISRQLSGRSLSYRDIDKGVKRFIIGLSKKIIFANQLAGIVEMSFGAEEPSFLLAWIGGICYSLQIYYDFSGYSDMAIGLGLLFGFHFPENFQYPCISKTVTEFWRRHHISLGRWFREYVYIPMGGSRVGKLRLIWNLFIVWLFTGLWHGASTQFLVWGMLFFFMMSFEKILDIPGRVRKTMWAVPYHLFTIVVIVVSWVIFGHESLESAMAHLSIMFFQESGVVFGNGVTDRIFSNQRFFLCCAILFATPVVPQALRGIKQKVYNEYSLYMWETTSTVLYMGLFFVSISYLVIGGHNPFIYFNF